MKWSCVVSCVLILSVCVCVLHWLPTDSFPSSLSASVEYQLSGRRLLRELSFPPMKPVGRGKLEVFHGTRRTETKREFMGRHKNDEAEGLIYYVDYHGVSTHPPPLPRHPKP